MSESTEMFDMKFKQPVSMTCYEQVTFNEMMLFSDSMKKAVDEYCREMKRRDPEWAKSNHEITVTVNGHAAWFYFEKES